MKKTARLKIITREFQLTIGLFVSPGLAPGEIARRLSIPDASFFSISRGRCVFLEPDVKIHPLINDGVEIVALVLDWEPHVSGDAELV